eukprot:GHVS01065744.1.p1 GENE.GHVS01065744.1~~GHVS01065744.1.p1  ORF type:complete len:605 (-),score=94.59 GHVS01065744.1:175-1989(-)
MSATTNDETQPPRPSPPSPPAELKQSEPTSPNSQTVKYSFNSLQLATNKSRNDKAEGRGRRSRMTAWLLFVVVFASMTGLLMGYDLAVVSVVLKPVTDHFGICPKGTSLCHQKEVFVAMIAPGALVGSIVGGSLADMFGRRWAMAVRDVAVIMGTILQATTDDYGVLLFGRATLGFGVGIGFVAFATYVSEVSPTDRRGQMVIIQEVAQCTGVLLAFVLVLITGDVAWRWLIGGAGFVAAINLPMVYFLPESPRWYVVKNRSGEARAVMRKLLQMEDGEIEENVSMMEREQRIQIQELAAFTRGGKYRMVNKLLKTCLDVLSHKHQVLVAIGVGIAQDFIATNAVLYYSTDIFRVAGVCEPYKVGVGIGIMKFVDTFFVLATVETLGRRRLLLAGSWGTFFCHIAFAITFAVLQNDGLARSPSEGIAGCVKGQIVMSPASVWVAIIMYLFIAAWDISWAGLMFVVASEILPSSIRGIGMGLSIFFFWLTLFITEISFQSMWAAMTIPGTFGFYACTTALVLVFVYLYVPETKGESLEEITEKFRLKKLGRRPSKPDGDEYTQTSNKLQPQLHTMDTDGIVTTLMTGAQEMTEGGCSLAPRTEST